MPEQEEQAMRRTEIEREICKVFDDAGMVPPEKGRAGTSSATCRRSGTACKGTLDPSDDMPAGAA